MNKFLISLVLFTSLFRITQAQKVSDYTIDVQFFPQDAQMWGYSVSDKSFMRGNAKIEFSEFDTDTLTFFLHGELKIDSIISDNNAIKFSSTKMFYGIDYSNIGLKTIIDFPDTIKKNALTIYYSGFMNPSRARSLSDYMHIDKKEGVFLRGYYYSIWFPVFQNPGEDDYEVNFKQVKVQLPKGFNSVIAGELLSETVEDDIYSAIWKPGIIKTSNIQCTAKRYKIISRDNIFVYFSDDRQSGERIISFTQKLKKLYYSTFRNVQNDSPLYILEMPEYGNISSHNVIGISSDLYKGFDTDLFSQLTIAHELVHPYVSIPVTKENSFSALLVEGFPSYFHLYGLNKISNDVKTFNFKEYMKNVENSYITKKRTGKDRRGNNLPSEKPILKITFDEIGQYKDSFILPDRVRLFLYHLLCEMGEENYDQFLKELFLFDTMNYDKFKSLIVKYLPHYGNDLNVWLNTNEYPESLHIK